MIVQKNLFRGFEVGKYNLAVSCLQFTNDTVFFKESSLQNILTLKSILRCFEMALGLRVNFYKSSITGLNIERKILQVFVDNSIIKSRRCLSIIWGY